MFLLWDSPLRQNTFEINQVSNSPPAGYFTQKQARSSFWILRDPLYTKEFLAIVAGFGIEAVKLPPRSPNLNAYAERFVRTIKESCLEQVFLFGEDSLRNAIREFVAHYHLERNHQGLNNRLIVPAKTNAASSGIVHRRQRLGGLLNYYYREAA
jgi:transposase InsO family protein